MKGIDLDANPDFSASFVLKNTETSEKAILIRRTNTIESTSDIVLTPIYLAIWR